MIENDWGATIRVSVWLQVIENLMVTAVLGALIIYLKSPEVIDPRVGSVI